MKNDVPLTPEQRVFAAEHHELVYKFLREHHLPEEEFYDVVIFGYLSAVRDYTLFPRMWEYPFATLGWKAMAQSLHNHQKAQASKKRSAETVSIHELFREPANTEKAAVLGINAMIQLEADLILHDLARHVSRQQMDVLNMRSSGYGIRDIARSQRLSMKQVHMLLAEVHQILWELCYE